METKDLALGISLGASPAEVFEVLTDSTQHSAFTGAESRIDATDGGSFSYLDGQIEGTFVSVSPERIVQSLRAAGWPKAHHAEVIQELEPEGDGERTYVRVRESGIPAEELDTVTRGWSGYWQGLSAYLRQRKLELVDGFVQRYKNGHDYDSVDEFISEDCRVHIPLPGLPQGREGMRLNGKLVNSAFPDVEVEREFWATEGDLVIERAHAKATHRGELMGLGPTGKPVTWTELHAYRVRDGKICEVWSEPDLLGVMRQLGVIEGPEQ